MPRINLSLQILLLFGLVALFGHLIPHHWQQVAYTLSLSINEVLLFVLPVIIFSCLLNCLLLQQGGAVSFILLLFILVTLSNYLSTLVGYGAGMFGYEVGLLNIPMAGENIGLERLAFGFPFKNPVRNTWALMGGAAIGLYFSIRPSVTVSRIASSLDAFCTFFLKKCFIPVLPLFALGFIIDMHFKGILVKILHGYLPVIGLIALTELLYLIGCFACAANFNPARTLNMIRNVIPTGIMGFSAMSSLAALPMTVAAAEANTGDTVLPKAIIPATVNNHLIGNSIATPIIAMTIMMTHGMDLPSLGTYCLFAAYFVISKFAVAGVPAGSVVVLQPLLREHLGFTTEMANLVMPLYIMIDPIITAGNVLGNGAFVILFTKLYKKKSPKPTHPSM